MSKPKFLITVGHLGKDVGAVSPYDFDGPKVGVEPQERWTNLQQVIGFIVALVADPDPVNAQIAIPRDPDGNRYVQPFALGDRLIDLKTHHFSLMDRVDIANNRGRWLVEFHNNAATVDTARGAEVIAWSRESAGWPLGQRILDELAVHGVRDRGVKTVDELGWSPTIIQRTQKPSIILEGGFLTTRQEASNLDVDLDGWNEQYGALVYRAIRSYWSRSFS